MDQQQSAFYDELRALEQRFNATPPELELTVRDPELGVEGFVVVWNTAIGRRGPLGPCGKGGTRITPTVSLDEIKMLARIMALKNAGAGLPLGGAKSGLRADPDAPGFEQRYRRFVSLVRPILRENGGVFGGFGFDIGGKPIHAEWACDELRSTRCFTGKPVEMGGTDYDREGIAGLGVVVAADTTLRVRGGSLEGMRIAVQGVGAMGAAVIRYATERGAVVQYISDPRLGGTYDLTHIKDPALVSAIASLDIEATRKILHDRRAQVGPLDAVLYQEVDILFPCAVQGVIGAENQMRIRAKLMVEGANNPASEEARTSLFKRGVTVIPDFVANPGGIIAAFVEMSSSVTPEENARTRRNVHDAKAMTETRIRENVTNIVQLADKLRVEPAHVGKLYALRAIATPASLPS